MIREWMRINGVDHDSFSGKLLIAYSVADLSNQKKLGDAFPFIRLAYEKFMNGERYSMSSSVKIKEV